MERMTSEPRCDHQPVYSGVFLASYPRQRPFICRLCGYEGVEGGSSVKCTDEGSEYDSLKEKKRTGGFRGPR